MDIKKIREDFPILQEKIKGRPLIYFDSACVSLKPKQVIDKSNEYYLKYSGCAGRSAHSFARKTTEEVEKARDLVAGFINARKREEIIFTRNATESINLVVKSLGLKTGDVVLLSDKEHSSNLIPCLELKKQGIAKETFEFGNIADFKKKLNKSIKLVSIVHTSNLDGTTNPIQEIIKLSHDNGSLVLLDAAQSIPHMHFDAKKLDVDFVAFSGHKMLGPSGIGALYGKKDLLEKLEPFILGGSTVKNSHYDRFEIDDIPMRFEAGLQNYAGIIGFGAAIEYLNKIGMKNVEKHEHELLEYAEKQLSDLPISILGKDQKRTGIISFNLKGMHPHDIAALLDASSNIMIRSGMHCVHSWFNAHNLEGSARASFYLYNAKEEIDVFVSELRKIAKMTS